MPEGNYKITFIQPKSEKFEDQLSAILPCIKSIKNITQFTGYIFDLHRIQFVYPLFILPIACLEETLSSEGKNVKRIKPVNQNCDSYLNNIYFPHGFKPDLIDDWESILNKYKGKNYLPIINFPTERSNHQTFIREKLISKINSLIKENLELDFNYESAVSYLISEIIDNIIEHAQSKRGWLTTQYYPSLNYLDICIIDTGIKIYGAYKNYGIENIKSDSEALDMALKGISTKSKERGSGLRTSHAISSLGLKGHFTLFSGSALFFKNQIYSLPVSWPGTFVAIRIKKGIENFSIYSFV